MMWAVNTGMGVALLLLLAVRKNYRVYPAFTFYIFVNIAVAASLFIVYRVWGFSSIASWRFGWATQAVTICARAWAVTELCRHLLSRYPGIWALARRMLLACAGLVLLYSGLAVRHQWKLALPTADRGLELSIAATLVALLVFARYYEVKVNSTDRSLAVGFCLYSCFSVLNYTILERFLDNYVALWNFLGMLAFLASLLLWTWALRQPQAVAATEEVLLPAGVYQTVAPKINLRLRLLNERLGEIWKTEATRN